MLNHYIILVTSVRSVKLILDYIRLLERPAEGHVWALCAERPMAIAWKKVSASPSTITSVSHCFEPSICWPTRHKHSSPCVRSKYRYKLQFQVWKASLHLHISMVSKERIVDFLHHLKTLQTRNRSDKVNWSEMLWCPRSESFPTPVDRRSFVSSCCRDNFLKMGRIVAAPCQGINKNASAVR